MKNCRTAAKRTTPLSNDERLVPLRNILAWHRRMMWVQGKRQSAAAAALLQMSHNPRDTRLAQDKLRRDVAKSNIGLSSRLRLRRDIKWCESHKQIHFLK